MIADLHIHSHYSDGEKSPEGLAKLFYDAGMTAVALTDHDCTLGTEEMTAACNALGVKNIAGVELSTHLGCDVHILGYNIDPNAPRFKSYLSEINLKKNERLEKILRLLKRSGVDVPMDAVTARVRGSVSRAHIALEMLARGQAGSIRECFERYMGEGKSCFVPIEDSPPERAVEEILAAGGIPVLAHPVRLRLSPAEAEELIKRLKAAGLMGLEAYYRNSTPEQEARFCALAEKNSLFITCGGDFHSEARNTIKPRVLPDTTAKLLGLL